MKAKPIVVITCPLLSDFDELRFKKALDESGIKKEYFVFLVGTPWHEGAPKWEVFHEKDFNEIKYKALKTLIEMKLNEGIITIKSDKVVIEDVDPNIPEMRTDSDVFPDNKEIPVTEEIPDCESCNKPMTKGNTYYHCNNPECKGGTL